MNQIFRVQFFPSLPLDIQATDSVDIQIQSDANSFKKKEKTKNKKTPYQTKTNTLEAFININLARLMNPITQSVH